MKNKNFNKFLSIFELILSLSLMFCAGANSFNMYLSQGETISISFLFGITSLISLGLFD